MTGQVATKQAFAVIYRWRLKPGKESQFVEAWRRATETIVGRCGSGGSCLHRGDDGVWVAYARWPSEQERARCFAGGPLDPEASLAMKDAIAETFAEQTLTVTDDLLRL